MSLLLSRIQGYRYHLSKFHIYALVYCIGRRRRWHPTPVPLPEKSHGLQPARLLCSRDSSAENTGVGCYFLLQWIFPTRGSNLCLWCLLHWQTNSLPLSHLGSPIHHDQVGVISVMQNWFNFKISVIVINDSNRIKGKVVITMDE